MYAKVRVKINNRLLMAGESGQAMTEYIFVVVLVALVVIPVLVLFPEVIQGYVRPFYYCISRPFP